MLTTDSIKPCMIKPTSIHSHMHVSVLINLNLQLSSNVDCYVLHNAMNNKLAGLRGKLLSC